MASERLAKMVWLGFHFCQVPNLCCIFISQNITNSEITLTEAFIRTGAWCTKIQMFVTQRLMIFIYTIHTTSNKAVICVLAPKMYCTKKKGSSLGETRGRQARVHLYSLLIAKVHVHSCIFSMVSSLYLPFSFPSVRDLALRSRIFLRSLSSFSLVITTYKKK